MDLLNEETEEKMSSKVLHEVADTLPKLRTALDKILSEAGDKSFKNLKVLGSWSPNTNNAEAPTEGQVPIETEDIPDRLSVKAAEIQEDIRNGNVKVAFSTDVEDKGCQMRLLLKEVPDSSTSMGQSVVLPGVASRKGKEMTRIGKSNTMDSTLRSIDMDALDLSTEPKKATATALTPDPWLQEIKLIDETIRLMQNASSHFGKNSDESEITMQNINEENEQAQEKLIKSIKKTLDVIDDKEVFDNLMGESEMVEKNLIQEEPQLQDSYANEWTLRDEELQDQNPIAELNEQEESKLFLSDEDYREERQTRMEFNEKQEAELRMELSEKDPEMKTSKYFTESEPIHVNYVEEQQTRMELDEEQEEMLRTELNEKDPEMKTFKYFTESEPIDVNYPANTDSEEQERAQFGDEDDLEQLEKKFQHTYTVTELQDSGRETLHDTESFQISEVRQEGKPTLQDNLSSDLQLQGERKTPKTSKERMEDWQDVEQADCLKVRAKHLDSPWSLESYVEGYDEESAVDKSRYSDHLVRSDSRKPYKSKMTDRLEETAEDFQDSHAIRARDGLQEGSSEDWEPKAKNAKLEIMDKHEDAFEKTDDEDMRTFKSSDESEDWDEERRYSVQFRSSSILEEDERKMEHLYEAKMAEDLPEADERGNWKMAEDKDTIKMQEEYEPESGKLVEDKDITKMNQDNDDTKMQDESELENWRADDKDITKIQYKSSDDHFDNDRYWKLEEVENWRNMRYFEEGPAETHVQTAEEKRSTKMGERRPHVSLDEANMRYYSDQKDGEGSHEWDWLLNNERIGKDASEHKNYEETLSRADEEDLEKLRDRLTQALKKDKAKAGDDSSQDKYTKIFQDADSEYKSLEDFAEVSAYDSENTLGDDEKDTEASKKRLPQREFAVPAPGATPAFIPRENRKPMRKSRTQEGTPQVQIEPRTAPSQQPHIRPHEVEFGNEQREVEKEESAAKPPQEQPPARRPAGVRVHKKKDIPQQPDKSPDDRLVIKNRKAPESNLDRAEKKMISTVRKGKDRQVKYSGKNPFNETADKTSKPSVDTDPKKKQGSDDGRRRVVISPPFNPPINPRVRVPRPPFDGREKEYHTLTSTLTTSSLVPIMRRRPMLKKNALRGPIVSSVQLKQLSAMPRPVQAIRRPSLQMPPGVPRSPAFTKILCALQIGFLASYLARFRKQR